MATEKKKVKTHKGKEEERNSNSTVAVDRISKLPDPVIYHILSFVPTVYAVRMSVLSRHWRRMWYSVPALDFSYDDGFQNWESFDMFVEQCLIHRSVATRYIADAVVTSFKLDIRYSIDIDRPVNRWSKSPIIQNDVKDLNIVARRHIKDGKGHNMYIPSAALNGRSLSIVKLEGVKLDDSCSMNLPSLKSLCLDYVTFDNDVNDTLHNLMIGCPALENFVFKDFWTNFGDIQISSSSVKFMEIETSCERVHIDALNLQSLVFYSGRSTRINFSSCTAIRDLSLPGFGYGNNRNFEDQISKLTRLENLTLNISETSKKNISKTVARISISSPTLKCFSLTKMFSPTLTVTTETPNLVSFKYLGMTDLSIAMKTPNPQLSGSFSIYEPEKYQSTCCWFTKLIAFLLNINCLWNSLRLCFDEEKDLIIPRYMTRTRRPPWPNLKHLKVIVFDDLTRESELRNVLHWLSPSLETLSVEKSKMKRF